MCQFDKSWVGQCRNDNVEGTEYCQEHYGVKCAICGEQATNDCETTMGPMVCGVNMCSNRECIDRHIASHEYHNEMMMRRWKNENIKITEDDFEKFIQENGGTIGFERMLDLFVSAWIRVDAEKVFESKIYEVASELRNEKAYRDFVEKRKQVGGA